MLSLFATAIAQTEAAAPAAQQPNIAMSLIPFVLIFFIFYFLMIKPQKKKMEEEQKFIDAIVKGDEVYTKSGMLGKVYGISGQVVTLEVAEGIKVKFLKSQIAGSSKAILEGKKEA